MSAARVDVTQFDDTALGAEVRHLHAQGYAMLILFDPSKSDRRAALWEDGRDGLYRLECPQEHVWLTKLTPHRRPAHDTCEICGLIGGWVDA